MKKFAEKVVAITGAGSGIGRALAEEFASLGAHLALSDKDKKGLDETAKSISGVNVVPTLVDVSSREEVQQWSDDVVHRFGHADIIINNAGVALSQTIEDVSYEDFEWLMNINFWGVVHGTKSFLPLLKQRKESAIVNISSVFGIISVPTQGSYNASKFAVRGFTEALRHEMEGTGVHVMTVHPGGIKTNIARNARFHVGPKGEGRDAGVRSFDKLARTTPNQAANKIISSLKKKSPRCLIGADAQVMDKIQRMSPEGYWNILSKLLP